MDGLVLAAGNGSRLRALGESKPLTRVNGVPLIELVVKQLMTAGVDRIVVVTGHNAEALEAWLCSCSAQNHIAIDCVRLADWSRPNGHSVLAGCSRIAGDYLLVMSDHLFSGSVLQGLLDHRDDDEVVTLAIDRRIDGATIDPDDATWVRTGPRDCIMEIGKHLTNYDAVDCGAFLATAELAKAIELAIASGKSGSLSDGMQVLADKGRAKVMDIGNAWWIDVDDPAAHAIAERQIAAHLPQTSTDADSTAAASRGGRKR